jgi:hypothetical protein
MQQGSSKCRELSNYAGIENRNLADLTPMLARIA